MSSYLSKIKKSKDKTLICGTCRDYKFRGHRAWKLTKETINFSVSDCGTVDYEKDNEDYYYEKEYGLSKKWYMFNEDYIGVK